MSTFPACMIGPSEPCEAFQALQAEAERLVSKIVRLHVLCADRAVEIERLRAERERLRRERNLAVEMLQSAERELAAERAARIAVASPVRQEGEP